jgi:glycosyl transferase family 87
LPHSCNMAAERAGVFSNLPYRPQSAALLALALCAGMWFYVQKIQIPYQLAEAAAHGKPRGNLSDLYPRWLGTRELLLRHRDPYSPEVTREIQTGYYGRPLDPVRPNDPTDEQRFAYPVYVAFLLAPTIRLPFPAVEAGFRWLLVMLTAGSVLLWMRVLRWRPSGWTVAALVLLTLGSFPAVQGIKLQQLSLLVSGLIAGCAALLAAGYLFLAGILLALATIKPQLTLPLAAWLVFWSANEWKTRQRFVWGFLVTMAALLAGAQLILPGWLGKFLLAISAYRQYAAGPGSLLDFLLTPKWGAAVTALLVLALAIVCWFTKRDSAESERFVITLALVLTVTIVVLPMFAPYNQLLLLPGLLLAWVHRRDLWRSGAGRLAYGVALVLVMWPWLASAGLALASFILSPATAQRAWALPIYTSPGIPLIVLMLLILRALPILRYGRGTTNLPAATTPELALPKGSG